MDYLFQTEKKLEDYICPAFTVINGKIEELNQAAAYLGLAPQQPVAGLLQDAEDYENFSGEFLYLGVTIDNTDFSAAVRKGENADLFILDHQIEQQLLTFSLVSHKIRMPLSDLMISAERLLEQIPDKNSTTATMRRSIDQLHRMACNMSDAARYTSESTKHQSTINVVAVFNETMDGICTVAEENGIRISYEKLDQVVNSLADPEMLERAVHNLMSNAMKFPPEGKTIHVSLRFCNNRLIFQVQDGGKGMSKEVCAAAFSQYLRKPGAFEHGRGLGLGLTIVRAAAAAHGGAVLLENAAEGGLRITLSIAVRKDITPRLSSPLPNIDYAGGRDHTRLELSDALSLNAYLNE